ncbi:transposase family protein [Deinococcus hopiensis]|uniref:transposase family protein n=1 Tax=Deinococcus hopiensis TaxID=309885 RepID=UPI003CCBD766
MGRPQDKARVCSVKQGARTLKTQEAVTPEGQLVHPSSGAYGRTHGMNVLWQFRWINPACPGVRVWRDRGYIWPQRVCPKRKTTVPVKRLKKGKLSGEQPERNPLFFTVQIIPEHAINRIKAFRACKARFRNNPKPYGVVGWPSSGRPPCRLTSGRRGRRVSPDRPSLDGAMGLENASRPDLHPRASPPRSHRARPPSCAAWVPGVCGLRIGLHVHGRGRRNGHCAENVDEVMATRTSLRLRTKAPARSSGTGRH